jgi:outer membrane autotransporter protein
VPLLLAVLVQLTLSQAHAADAVIHGQTIDTSTAQTAAVEAKAGTTVQVTDSQVTTRGTGASALASSGTLTGSGLTLRTTGVAASAVDARDKGTVTLTGTQVSTEGAAAVALQVRNSGSVISLRNGSISTRGDMGYGVHAELGGRVELDNVAINTSANNGIGAKIYDGGSLDFAATHINTLGREAHGLLLMGKDATARAQAQVKDSSITTRGDLAIGINVNMDASAVVQNSQISTAGDHAEGVWLANMGTHTDLTGVHIQTSGKYSSGVSSQGGTATLQNVTIATSGEQSHGLYTSGATSRIDATGINISLDNVGAGVYAVNRSQIHLTSGSVTTRNGGVGLSAASGGHIAATTIRVDAQGNGARALLLTNGASLALDNVLVSASGIGSTALRSVATSSNQVNKASLLGSSLSAAQGSAIAVSGGQLELSVEDSAISGQHVLDVQANGAVAHGAVTVNALNSALTGDVRVTGASTGAAQLKLDRSVLTGAVQGVDRLDVLDSRWNITGDSSLGSLNNQGTVAFQPGALFMTLTVKGDLTGSGAFVMNTDLAGLRGDLLQVQGITQGNHTLAVADSGKEPHTANGELMLVDGNGGDGRFALAGRPHVDAGAFRYTLEQQGDDWFLRNTSQRPGPDSISDGSNAALGNQAAAATLWTAEMNALVKRLGELRMGDDKGGVWARGIGKSYKVDNGYGRDFEQTIHGLEVGADSSTERQGGRLYIGGMVGAATSRQHFGEGGSGEIDSQLLGVYSTWIDDSGFYVDAVGKYNRMVNQVKTLANTSERIKGDYHTHGYAADIEVGKHIALESGWFIEPQLEATYTFTRGADYTASNGLRVVSDDAHSLQARAGGLFGKTLTLASGMAAQPYVKAAYVQEFAGHSTVNVNGHKLRNQVTDSRAELGLGGVLQVNAKTKVSLDVQHTEGHQVREPWAVNVGVRYLW